MDFDIMNTMHRVEHYGDSHHTKLISIGRVLLGVFRFYKGLLFIRDTSCILDILQNSGWRSARHTAERK